MNAERMAAFFETPGRRTNHCYTTVGTIDGSATWIDEATPFFLFFAAIVDNLDVARIERKKIKWAWPCAYDYKKCWCAVEVCAFVTDLSVSVDAFRNSSVGINYFSLGSMLTLDS